MAARPVAAWTHRFDRRWLAPMACLLLLAGLALAVVFVSTRHGIGLRDDSFHYFSAAESLVRGAGYGRVGGDGQWIPLTNFPPGYTALLGILHAGGLELAAAARLLNGLALAWLIMIVGLTVAYASRQPWAGVISGGMILISPSIIEVFSWAHSEAVYLALVASGLLLVVAALRTGRSASGWWLAAGAALTLACLTRYVGIAACAAGAVAVMVEVRSDRQVPRSLLPLASLVGLPALGLAVLATRNWLVSGGLVNRPAPYWHPPQGEALAQGGNTILGWLLPANWLPVAAPAAAGGALLALTVFLVPLLILRAAAHAGPGHDEAGWRTTTVLHASHVVIYASLLLTSLLLFDRLTPLDDRILSPALVSLVILAGLGIAKLLETRNRITHVGRSLAVMALIGLVGYAGWMTLAARARESQGFNSPLWRSSLAMEIIAPLPDRPIYSNNIAAFYFLTDRRATSIPIRTDPASGQPREDYESSLEAMHTNLRASGGYLVLLGWPPEARVEAEHLMDLIGEMTVLERTRDGLILCYCDRE